MPIPVIETDRLVLRTLQLDDAEDIYGYAQDDLVARPGMWEPYASFDKCVAHVERLVADERLMWWVLEHKIDRRVIGRVELSGWIRSDAHAELSYALSRPYWGQGLMTEAAAVAADYGWRELGLHRLSATVRPENVASVRVLQRLGMEREGRLRDYRRLYGEWVDVDVYAAIA